MHPYKIEAKKLKDILSNIKYIKTTTMGDYEDYLFSEEELNNIVVDLENVVKNLKPEEAAVVVAKYDPIKSVISVHKRTSFMIWFDASGMNIVFGEIQRVVTRETIKSQSDWTIIPEIYIKGKVVSNVKLNEKDRKFTYKLIDGYPNKRWIVFDLTNLQKYKFNKRDKSEPQKL